MGSRMNFFLLAITFSIIVCSLGDVCPLLYQRYSKEHSFCKPNTTSCPVSHKGVTNTERVQILDIHNKYRSLVAMGGETAAGGLPQAADMMQMTWDTELEAIAQKHAEKCVFEHDCGNCRKVENFPVGQNMYESEIECGGSCELEIDTAGDWTNTFKAFYGEVELYNKEYVNKHPSRSKGFGHFTQMVWAKTWRVGCGFVAHRTDEGYKHLHVCNYGPSGNLRDAPLYKAGTPCSSCPANACCGSSCSSPAAEYEGLCRMNGVMVPRYPPEEDYTFYCDFSSSSGDCSASVDGAGWKFVQALGGPFAEIVLKGGESSTLKLTTAIQPEQNSCFVIKYRSGPAVDGQENRNDAVLSFEAANSKPVSFDLPRVSNPQTFMKFSISRMGTQDTMVSFKFIVPSGAPDQFFNVGLAASKNGKC